MVCAYCLVRETSGEPPAGPVCRPLLDSSQQSIIFGENPSITFLKLGHEAESHPTGSPDS